VLDAYDQESGWAVRGTAGRLLRRGLGWLVLPAAVLAGLRSARHRDRPGNRATALFAELTGRPVDEAIDALDRVQRQLAALDFAEPALPRRRLELAAAALVDVALVGGGTGDEAMRGVLTAYDELDEAARASRRAGRRMDFWARHGPRYLAAWQRWFTTTGAAP
jgi:hypothetical protein